jgi:hypothetical protein
VPSSVLLLQFPTQASRSNVLDTTTDGQAPTFPHAMVDQTKGHCINAGQSTIDVFICQDINFVLPH